MGYRVVIPTAGIGSRLNELTKYINKSLVSIANRPTISHLIEQFPNDCEFVIALGHKGNLVQDFLELTYPNRVFYFVNIDPYEGSGSGLGLSLLACENFLQEPFVFISCDTLVKGYIREPNHNWMGFTMVDNLTQYRTLFIEYNKISKIFEKGVFKKNLHAYIGLAGIYDYQIFWNTMHDGHDNAIKQGESYGMKSIIANSNVVPYEFEWFDMGNPKSLSQTRKAYQDSHQPNILEKANEAIWFIDSNVVKFSDDKSFISNRVKRAEDLKGFVPEVYNQRPNMYCYKKIEAKVLSDVITIPIFDKLLIHSQNFWLKRNLTDDQELEFNHSCLKFYRDKTLDRIQKFYNNFNKFDNDEIINGEEMPLLKDLMNSIDWEWMSKGVAVRFHGDFHFENILWSEVNNEFTFLDWRQDFAGNLTNGDIYYDLAKLMHGIIVNHEIIATDQYSVSWTKDEIKYYLQRKPVLVECEKRFSKLILTLGYDLRKVKVLTALIYLNIAALHHFPYSLFLYGLGKKMLKNEIEKKI